MGALVALVVFVIQDQADKLGAQIGSLLIATALFTLLTLMAGAATAWKLGLNAHEQFTFAVEYAARNLAIATVVGATLLGHTEFVVFAAAFFITQVPLMLAAVMISIRAEAAGGRDRSFLATIPYAVLSSGILNGKAANRLLLSSAAIIP